MRIDNQIYTFQDTIKWSFNSFIIKEFHYDEPMQNDIIRTDLEDIKWRFSMSFSIDETFSMLSYEFDVIVSFPNRDTKILHDYVKMREVTSVNLLGVETSKDDKDTLRELVAHCAAMNWMNILGAISERTYDTALAGKIKSPFFMRSQFMPTNLDNLNTLQKPNAKEANKYNSDELQRAIEILGRAGTDLGMNSMPAITQVQWAFDVVRDKEKTEAPPDTLEKARQQLETKKQTLQIDFEIGSIENYPDMTNPLYRPINLRIKNGSSAQEIVNHWLEDKKGEEITNIYPGPKPHPYSIQPFEELEIPTGYFSNTNDLVRGAVRLNNWHGPIIWSEYKELKRTEKEKGL